MTSTTRTGAVIVAVSLLVAAGCGGDDDASSDDTTTTTTATTTTPTTTTAAPVTTEAAATTTAPEPPPATSASTDLVSDEVPLLDFEFQPVPAGTYRVETIGAPFTIDIPDGWFVQPNSWGHFVITDPASTGPGDRDIVMIRPSNLADPDQPGLPPEEQAGDWPLDDIGGWLAALIPGVVDGGPIDTTLGGLDAVRFDVSITDEVDCGEDDGFCVGFATNRRVNDMWFDRRTGYRVWWIDGGDEAPIAVNIGDGTDPAFTEHAEAVLDTVAFESIGPNPIPADGNLWELGISAEVPAGTITLPVGPSVTFELSEPRFVFQDDFFSGVLSSDPYEADIFFPDQAFDDVPVADVQDVLDAIERSADFTTTIVGTRDVSGFEATEVDITGPLAGPDAPPVLQASELPGAGWNAPPDGTLWIMETPDGLAVITAEWFEPSGAEPARALAEEILDSIVIGG